MKRRFSIFLLLFSVAFAGFSQVEFKTKLNKDEIGVNERLRVDFEMDEDGDNFTPPDFDDFKVIGGPNQQISHSWVNGKSTYSKTYSFFLEPKERGDLTVGQAKITVDGKTYKTSPKTVKVTEAKDHPKNGKGGDIKVSDKIHLVAEVSNAAPFLNEGITVTYKLYFSNDTEASDLKVVDNPKFSNFWSQDMDIKKLRIKHGSYKGDKDYRYAVLRRTVLYPQDTGQLEIEPLTISLAVKVPTNRRDPFGRRVYEPEDKTISSKTRAVEVKPLPEKGKPDDFSGAVGNFDFAVSPSKDSLDADESLDIEVRSSGTGNLSLFDLPELDVPSGLEAYSPEDSENVETDRKGMHGHIKNSYTVVPKMKGDYTVEPLSFSYFDPESESYKTIKSDEFKIKVKNGPSQQIARNDSTDTVRGSRKKRVVSNGDQFRYIKLKTKLHDIKQSPFFKSKLFWALLFLPVVMVPVAIGFGNKQVEKANDIRGNRLRRANRLTKKYLSEAKKNLGEKTKFYGALERALHNYLKAKLDIQTSDMSKERIQALLYKKNVKDGTGQDFIGLIESCERARYSPFSETEMEQDYDQAAETISEIDKQLQK